MGEQLPRSVPELYMVDGRSLKSWPDYLTTDKQSGDYNGYLETPGIKYGSTADECAWWAVAAHSTYTYLRGAVGEEFDAEQSMEIFMELAVNNDWTLVHLVRDMQGVLPRDLVNMLDWDRAQQWQ